jgi:hypothetical protein
MGRGRITRGLKTKEILKEVDLEAKDNIKVDVTDPRRVCKNLNYTHLSHDTDQLLVLQTKQKIYGLPKIQRIP